MERVELDGVHLEYEARGSGPAVLLVHAGVLADWFLPLSLEPVLEHHHVIRYHRIGYAGSSPAPTPTSIADQAGHALALLRHLGVERVHAVGHSSGANIAMQLALDEPSAVATLTLVEPAVKPDVPSRAAFATAAVAPAMQHAGAGRWREAVDAFMNGVAFVGYRDVVDDLLPGALSQAELDAPTFFGVELPSLAAWPFTESEALALEPPVLSIVGADSVAMFQERHQVLLDVLPDCVPLVVPGATHLLPLAQPSALAEGVAAFVARHPG